MAAEKYTTKRPPKKSNFLRFHIFLLFLISQTLQNEITKIENCICGENDENCLSSISIPRNVIFSSNFTYESNLDQYNQARMDFHETYISFGRGNRGRSLGFGPRSKFIARIMNSEIRGSLTLEMWVRFTGNEPFGFSSVLEMGFVRSFLKSQKNRIIFLLFQIFKY